MTDTRRVKTLKDAETFIGRLEERIAELEGDMADAQAAIAHWQALPSAQPTPAHFAPASSKPGSWWRRS